MANPQIEDGYTRIANELYEALGRADFNRREHKLLYAVIRDTYGWNRKMTKTSKLELFRRVGLLRHHGYMTLRDLLRRKVLIQSKDGIGLEKNYEAWLPPTSTETVLVPKRYYNQVGTSRDTKTVLVTSTESVLSNRRKRPSSAASGAPKDNKDSLKDNNVSLNGICTRVIGELNTLTGRSFRPTARPTIQAIRARIEDDYSEGDLLAVVRDRVAEWQDNPEMRKHLCPDTLFRPSKFEKYYQLATHKPKSDFDRAMEELRGDTPRED